jgi:hypothetical protein
VPKAHLRVPSAPPTSDEGLCSNAKAFFVFETDEKIKDRAVVQLVRLFINRRRPVSRAVGTFESRQQHPCLSAQLDI